MISFYGFFVFLAYIVFFLFFLVSLAVPSHYHCKWLPRKTRLWNGQLCFDSAGW